MKFSYNILIISLVFLVLTVGAVSAAENTSDVQTTVDSDASAISHEDIVVESIESNDESNAVSGVNGENNLGATHNFTGNSFADLQTTIKNANSGDTIVLNKDCVYNIATDTITQGIIINKTLTINGNGHTIDAAGKSRIFYINATNNVVINNITFLNGHVSLSNNTFEINAHGGAILLNASYSTVSNCNFINNTAGLGGGISICNFTQNNAVDKCNFINNSASYRGGAIRSTSVNLIISDSKFINNLAVNYGGAVAITFDVEKSGIGSKNVTIKNCDFISNNVTGSEGCGGVIGICSINFTIINCNFVNNTATYGGGAMMGSTSTYIDPNTMTKSLVKGCTFINNSAIKPDDGWGGAIQSQHANLAWQDCIFENNFATHEGGALSLGGSAYNNTIDNCSFSNNTGNAGSALRICQPAVVKNSVFTNNSGYEIYLINNKVNVVLSNNTISTTIFTNGGKILSKTNVIILNNSTVYYNKNSPSLLEAVVTDDNNNLLVVKSLSFKLENGTIIKATYNSTSKTWTAKYTFTQYDDYIISATSDSSLTDNTIFNGTVAIREFVDFNISTYTGVYGENATLCINITEDATGKIVLAVGNNTYTIILNDAMKGLFKYNISGLNAGNYNVKAQYLGDSLYAPANANAILIVNKKPTPADDINITNLGNTTAGNATLVVKVHNDLTGNISVIIGDKTYTASINNGVAIVDLSNVCGGTHDVTVTYSGNENNEPVSKNTIITIDKKPTPPSDINITDGNVTGGNGTFEVSVPKDHTGNITVVIDNKTYTAPIENGTAKVNLTGVEPGSHNATVIYSGDENNEPTSKNTTIVIGKIPTPSSDINVTNPVNLTSGNATLVVLVPKDHTGNITVNIGGKNYTAPIANGTAKVDLNSAKPGNYNATVYYSGDKNHEATHFYLTVKIPEPFITLIGNNVNALYSATATYKVLVLSDGKNITNGENITITYNGVKYIVKTLNGYATLNLKTTLKVGTYTVTVNYANKTITNKVVIKNIINAKKLKKLKKSKKVNKVKVSLAKVNGKYLKGKKLTLKLKGKKVATAKTNKKGVATFKVKKKKLKKFKKGKKVKATVTYGKDVVTKKIKIVK